MINSKEQIIEYFKSGINKLKILKLVLSMKNFFSINLDNKRIDYPKIKQMFEALLEFGWNPILEKEQYHWIKQRG